MLAVRVILVSVLIVRTLASSAAEELDLRRISEDERALVGPSYLVFANGLAPNLVHMDARSAYDPKEQGIEAGLAGSAGALVATVGLPVAIAGTLIATPIVYFNADKELAETRADHAEGFAALRAALGGYDCRLRLARALDAELSAKQPWLRIERVLFTEDLPFRLARSYASEPIDALIVVDAKCGMSADLGDARITATVEVYSKRFGPLAHAIAQEEGPPLPAAWDEEPVYRNEFLGRLSRPLAELVEAEVAARRAQIEADYAARRAATRSPQHAAELAKWHAAALRTAENHGLVTYAEYLVAAKAWWPTGEPTELQRSLEAGSRKLAELIAEDLGKPPEPKSKRKKKDGWVQARPVVLQRDD